MIVKVTIHGVEYDEYPASTFAGEEQGPCLIPAKYHPTAPVRCGKCRGTLFTVRHLAGEYETWCDCACGNKFVVHSG